MKLLAIAVLLAFSCAANAAGDDAGFWSCDTFFEHWFFCPSSSVDEVEMTCADYVEMKVATYVHGFNEFDTSIVILSNQIRVGMYYDYDTQSESRAEELRRRMVGEITARQDLGMLGQCATDYEVVVTVYGEGRTTRGYTN